MAKNLRLILVEAIQSKIYQSILNRRLNDFYESFAPEFSNGFRSGRGTADANFVFKSVLRKRKEHNLESWVLFLDLIKAFDKVDRTRLWAILKLVGVAPKMIAVLRSLYRNRTADLTMEGIKKTMTINGGSGQGMILAPRIFSLYLHAIFELWLTDNPDALLHIKFNLDDQLSGQNGIAMGQTCPIVSSTSPTILR